MSDIKKVFANILLIVLLIVLVFAGYKLYEGFSEYWKDYLKTLEAQNTAGRAEKNVDWDKLKKMNDDVIAWIYCPDTVIDYPIVQGKDNDKYLSIGINGKWSGTGTLFADCTHENPLKEPNTIIYGHHMRDGSMFHDLDDWRSQEYFDKHPVMYIYTPTQNYKLQLTNCSLVNASDEKIYTSIYSEEDFIDFINKISDSSKSTSEDFDIKDADYQTDQFVTLSTCAYDFTNARTVLVGKLELDGRSVSDIEVNKEEPKSKMTMFFRMVKDIVLEGIGDVKNLF